MSPSTDYLFCIQLSKNNINYYDYCYCFTDIVVGFFSEKDECRVEELSPCQNSGSCLDGIGDYSCECTANFTGKNCTESGKFNYRT